MNVLEAGPPGEAPPRATLVAPPRARWGKRIGVALLWIGIIAAAMGAYRWYSSKPPPMPAGPPAAIPALTVAVAAAESRPLAPRIAADGSIAAWQELALAMEIGGLRVAEVLVEEGAAVRAGDPLLRLDAAVLRALAAQAEAAWREAGIARDLAAAEARRAEALGATASVQLREQREAAALQAEARLAVAAARRDEAAARLAQATLTAPADGVVSRVTARIGAVLAPGQEVMRLLRDGRLELEARVPELDLPAVAPGQAATVIHGARRIEGRVRAIAPVVAQQTRLGTVHIALPPESGLRPGMFARAEITGTARPVVMLPAAAVVFREGGAVAFVLPPGAGHVEQRRLSLGERTDGMVAVEAGVAAGEAVVVAGAGFLADGDLVRVAQ